MGGPGLARMYAVTNDRKYPDALNAELGRMADLRYGKEEHLYYRDKGFIAKKTRNGKKVFWSRVNGWVFGGLAKLLSYMPETDPARARYVTIFKDMAAKLATLQQPDGTWYPSLLDPAEFPDSETSGTALDGYAFAWGINHNLLNSKTYLPVAAAFHLVGPGDETRHLCVHSEQAALSPPWSIHAGCGTRAYASIWAMGGENQRFTDMDGIGVPHLL